MSLEHSDPSSYCGRKRRADSDLASPNSAELPPVSKRQRRGRERSQQHTRFWDTLSKVRLSQGALREFDRRRETDTQRKHCEQIWPDREPFVFRGIKQFARRGGPSLTHLRGYANSATTSRSSARSWQRSVGSRRSGSTRPFKSSPYTPNYEQKLIDSGIYPNDYDDEDEGPANGDEILTRLTATRASLSPSRFTEQDFKDFRRHAGRAQTETSTMQNVFSTIEGGNHGHRSAADVLFTHMKPMAKDLAQAKPDLYDGAEPERIDVRVRAALHEHILPSNKSHLPAAPNFFIEGKSVGGRADVARLQACDDGALGARAMHSFQNFGKDELGYDGKAYSFTNTYHDGTLKMYAHHLTAPKQPEGDPEYRMTHLNSFAMTGNVRSFREGATAYRNLRDYAKEQRDSFIDQANGRASTMPVSTSSSRITSTRSVRTASFAEESDTSLDELSRDELTVKRARPSSPMDDRSVSSGLRRDEQPTKDGRTSTPAKKKKTASTKTSSPPPTRVETR